MRPLPLLLLAASLACAAPRPRPAAALPEPPRSLYDRLGGQPAVEAAVTQLLAEIGSDPRINFFFGLSDLAALHRQLVAFVCAATGGPCRYAGPDMRAAHRGMGISGAQFDALAEDLAKALDRLHVGAREKGELLSALGPLKAQIVEVR